MTINQIAAELVQWFAQHKSNYSWEEMEQAYVQILKRHLDNNSSDGNYKCLQRTLEC